jgi:phosphodiesterase/alkaline phosphatase D-like protein
VSFEEDALRELVGVGATDAQSVRLWLRAEVAGDHDLELSDDTQTLTQRFRVRRSRTRDGIESLCYPHDFTGARPLAPARAYRYRVVRGEGSALLGEGHFETAPSALEEVPERFALAFTSCHQPFDGQGRLDERALSLLHCAEAILNAQAVKRLVLTGDQIYADTPHALSLFDEHYFRRVAASDRRCIEQCTAEEVRRLYHQRYRIFWKVPAF